MAWFGQGVQKSLSVGLLGLFLWAGSSWGQAVIITIPPSNLTSGEKSEGSLGFGCYDIHTLLFINCHVSVNLDPLDPAAMIPPFFGGHIAHSPQPDIGTVRDSRVPGSGGRSVVGDTLQGFSGITYTAPEASGQVQVTTKLVPPPSYFCLSEPDPDGFGACRGIEVDINRAPLDPNGNPVTPMDCVQDVTLRAAVDWLAVDTGLPELLCESGGRKHITF